MRGGGVLWYMTAAHQNMTIGEGVKVLAWTTRLIGRMSLCAKVQLEP